MFVLRPVCTVQLYIHTVHTILSSSIHLRLRLIGYQSQSAALYGEFSYLTFALAVAQQIIRHFFVLRHSRYLRESGLAPPPSSHTRGSAKYVLFMARLSGANHKNDVELLLQLECQQVQQQHQQLRDCIRSFPTKKSTEILLPCSTLLPTCPRKTIHSVPHP